jgi:hypothetical protein
LACSTATAATRRRTTSARRCTRPIFEHIKTLAKAGSDDAQRQLSPWRSTTRRLLKQALLNACEALQKGLEARTPPLQGGAVSVVALVVGEQLIVANSRRRALRAGRQQRRHGRSASASTTSRTSPEEKARIEKEGGFVTVAHVARRRRHVARLRRHRRQPRVWRRRPPAVSGRDAARQRAHVSIVGPRRPHPRLRRPLGRA